jgi:hypothetical protein
MKKVIPLHNHFQKMSMQATLLPSDQIKESLKRANIASAFNEAYQQQRLREFFKGKKMLQMGLDPTLSAPTQTVTSTRNPNLVSDKVLTAIQTLKQLQAKEISIKTDSSCSLEMC